MNEPSGRGQQQERAPLNFSLIVSGLFVVIIALLAILCMRERTSRVRAQNDLATMARRHKEQGKQQALQQALSRMLAAGSGRGVQPFGRADLIASRDVRLDGKSRQALYVTAEAGRRLGFRAGDLIIVSKVPPAATQATSEPSTGPRP